MTATTFYPVLAASSDLLIYLLPTAGFMLLFFGIYQVFDESRTSQRRKMQQRLRGERQREEKAVASILRRGAMTGTKSFADELIGKFKFVPRLQIVLDQADVDWSAAQTLVNLTAIAVAAGVGLFAWKGSILLAAGTAVAIVALPLMTLSFMRKRRMAKLAQQLPDVFDMMGQALRAGHSLAGAIQLVYEQMPPPIATEFAQVYHEQNLGVKVEDALQSMARRVESMDVNFFVTAVMIQRQTGGDLAEVLDNISGVIRGRIELAGMVRGLTAEGRLSGWVLFALPALVFVFTLYLNPDYGSILLEDPRGQLMLLAAAGMQLMGIAMIRWIVNIKV
jgi:tight adherence protein B